MAVFFIILGVVLIGLSFILSYDGMYALDIMLAVMGTVVFMIGLIMIATNDKPQPTALDVYRGKTTLEITYRDSIPVDSVVVFKKN